VANNPPSVDPANQDSLLGMIQSCYDKQLSATDDMLPARVIAFDRAANRVQVQPLIRMVTTSGQSVSRAQIASLPVVQMGGGGMVMLFNLSPGDLGWIKANDRDVSLFLQSGGESNPNTYRKHKFEDAVFIPDVVRGWTLASEDAANAVLQTTDGSVRIALWPDRVKVTAGEASMTITNAGTTFSGAVSMPDGATIGGIAFGTHKHTGVQTGSGTSGGPTS
jgi:hypothetical protein